MNITRQHPSLLWATCAALLVAIATPGAVATDATPPGKMAFQGFLTDSLGAARGSPTAVNTNVTFKLYNGSTVIWAESQVVTVDHGHFSVVLGEGTAVVGIEHPTDLSALFTGDNSSSRYLGITVGTETEISPRIQFLSAPYAHLARYATELVGSSGSSVLTVGAGTVTIGTTAAPGGLGVYGNITATGTFAGNGASITNLPAAQITGYQTLPDDVLSYNVARWNNANFFSEINTFTENVGIGVFPEARMHISETTGTPATANHATILIDHEDQDGKSSIVFRSKGNRGSDYGYIQYQDSRTTGGENSLLTIGVEDDGNSDDNLALMPKGNVGIGTITPQSKLDVNGIVRGTSFTATSDARVKVVSGTTDGRADLATLLGIEITNFRYKKIVDKTGRPQKKVIAQQVEKVFPAAVSTVTDVVPDICRSAGAKDGWIHLATDLANGDRVRLLTAKHDGIHAVSEIAEGKFRTDFTSHGDEVFVYGREVNDFRTVDYEAIAMLNVSATQELARQVAALRKSEALVAELQQKVSRVEALERDLDQLKKAVARMASVREEAPAIAVAATGESAISAVR